MVDYGEWSGCWNMSKNTNKLHTFYAKKDFGSQLSFLVIVVIVNVATLFLLGESNPFWFKIFLGLGSLFVNLFLGGTFYYTYYIFYPDVLYLRSGLFVEKIPYTSISSIKYCSNYYSSMALARERIEITQRGKNKIMGITYVSPKNRERFVACLEEQGIDCSNVHRHT